MAVLKFNGSKIKILIEHAKAAPKHNMPYGIGKSEPGLMLVKDDGIYLMSNGEPSLPGSAVDQTSKNAVVYAEGYGSYHGNGVNFDEQWDKIREAVGGDDFAEHISLDAISNSAGKWLVININPKTFTIHWSRR